MRALKLRLLMRASARRATRCRSSSRPGWSINSGCRCRCRSRDQNKASSLFKPGAHALAVLRKFAASSELLDTVLLLLRLQRARPHLADASDGFFRTLPLRDQPGGEDG